MKWEKRRYFIIHKDINKTECLTCGKQLSGSSSSNIKRHYKLVHKIDIGYAKCEFYFTDEEESTEGPPPAKQAKYTKAGEGETSPATEQQLTTTARDNDAISVRLDKNQFLKCCLGMVIAKNIPIRIFDDGEFFKTLISPYEQKYDTNLNSRNLPSLMESASINIQETVMRRLRNKMISLKLDIATRMNKCVLAINVQYIRNFEMCINTLGTVQLQKGHKPPYLKYKILKCLVSNEIDMDQIYSCTTDSGTSVVRGGILPEELQEDKFCEDLVHLVGGTIVEDTDNVDDENIHAILPSELHVVRCVAHAVQLAAADVLKQFEIKINECRIIVKKIATLAHGDGDDRQMPILDNDKLWYSTFEMLKALMDNKDRINTLYTELTDSQIGCWKFIKHLLVTFEPLAKCAKHLQSELYIIGDFYRDWLSCELELENLFTSTPSAIHLYEAMKNRRQLLLENETFLAALYLDPRFNFTNSRILSEEQKTKAVSHLEKTFEVIQRLENSHDPENLLQSPNGTFDAEPDVEEQPTTSKTAYDLLTKHILKLMAANASKTKTTELSFKQKLSLLSNSKMVALDTDILKYWQTSHIDPDIAKIITVALAVPANHVSIERAFNALSVIQSKSNTSAGTLNNLLMTKLNFKELNSNDVQLEYTGDPTDDSKNVYI